MIRVLVASILAAGLLAVPGAGPASAATPRTTVWPAAGQAAYAFAGGPIHRGPGAHVAPIASMAKTMTAYLVLSAYPLSRGGFTMRVRQRDVDDYRLRVSRGESTVPVSVGEALTERQALAALLLPSANNVAIMLARRVAGTVTAFVGRMNRAARALGMRYTVYTDPSGFDARTRSTPRDQLVLARHAIAAPALRAMVARRSYVIPVAGRIDNTDTLLGSDGFGGIKTGSMSASGGCFMALSVRRVAGRRVALFAVVMGQQGSDLIAAGLTAARRLVDRVAPTPG